MESYGHCASKLAIPFLHPVHGCPEPFFTGRTWKLLPGGGDSSFPFHFVDTTETSGKIPRRGSKSSGNRREGEAAARFQMPPNAPGMSFARWWGDIRFEQERRILAISGIILFLTAVFVGILSYTKIKSMRDDEGGAAAPSVSPKTGQAISAYPEGILEKAGRCVSDSRFAEAAPLLRSAELTLNRLQGTVAWKTGDTKTAEMFFERALSIEPESVPDLTNLANLRLQTGNAVSAAGLFKKAREAGPEDAYVANRYLLARIEAGDGDAVEAEIRTAWKPGQENSVARMGVPAAFLELADGRYASAASFLGAAQKALAPETFRRLLNEPPISSYANLEELRPFFAASTVECARVDKTKSEP